MPSIPSSANPDLTCSSLNGLMIASIFFMSGNRRPFAELIFSSLPSLGGKKVRGSSTPSKPTSSQGTHAHGLFNRLSPLSPLVVNPLLTLLRELTFGPPPNEAISLKQHLVCQT